MLTRGLCLPGEAEDDGAPFGSGEAFLNAMSISGNSFLAFVTCISIGGEMKGRDGFF